VPEPAAQGPGAVVVLAAAGVALLVASPVGAYGPDGHRAAGRTAAPLLCERAAGEVERLGGGDDLGELGLWADQIRSDPDFAAAAPWHYINVADGEALAAIRPPLEGDVLWAIGEFSGRLADLSLDDATRSVALKFLTHFIVDLHQPLHVGLAADRGGNEVALRFRGQSTNLHRLWDTHVIERTDESIADYTAELMRLAAALDPAVSLDPLVWAQESLDLRTRVYNFGAAGREPRREYLDFAARVTRERLAVAALRLAGTLNAILCDPAQGD
jgi:hypothetical protein